MNIRRMAEALQILAKYAGDQEFGIEAEHDEIWVGDEQWPLTDEERAKMEECGFSAAEPGMGWHAFV